MTSLEPFLVSGPDTIVVCRSVQLREAAVVLACFGASAQPMLFVLDPPPCSEQEFKALHESYRTMRDQRDEALGQRKSRLTRRNGTATEEWSNEEIDRRVDLLTPFRKWVKHNLLFGELAKGLSTLRRALFLFEANERDVTMFQTIPVGKISDDRRPFLPEKIEWLFLLPEAAESGVALAQKAWRLVRGAAEPFPGSKVEAAPDSVSVISGLHQALCEGVPLVIDERVSDPMAFSASRSATEAVLVEASDAAAKLVAVQYAIHNGAKLCVYPAPDVCEIERCCQNLDERGDCDPYPLFQNIERAVAAAIPSRVIEEVGDLPVTAYTVGVPYHFLPNWSKKPIGLMAGDELLLTSIELYRQQKNDRPHFNILFDPGYFNPQETEGVLAALKSIPAYPLVFQELAASNTALIASSGASVDLLYFNTHGTSASIVLPDLVLPGYKLLQRVTLRNHPAVFNNACLSWTGVGREFVEVGARCYLGTLWRVDAAEAAKFAIAVVSRIIGGARPIAASIHDTGADAITERAYIYVGPVRARLHRYDETAAGGNRRNLFATTRALLQIAMNVADSGPPTDSPMTWPVIRCLREGALRLCEEIDREFPEASVDRLDLISDQLALGNKLRLDARTADFYSKLSMRGLKMASELVFQSRDEWKTKGHFMLVTARLAQKLEQRDPAINLLRKTADELERAGVSAGSHYLDLSDLYRGARKYDLALESALRAQEAFEKPQETAEGKGEALRGSMLALGRLAQLWRLTNESDKALTAARSGYQAAIRADDLKEQTSFKIDESRYQMDRRDFTAAVTAARDALQTALRSRDDDLKISAFGTLARAQIFAGELKGARTNATEGRNLALERGSTSEIVDFQMDLCDIESKEGDLTSALSYLREASDCLVALGDKERIKRALNRSSQLMAKVTSWEALSDVLLLASSVFSALDANDRSTLCTALINRVISQIGQGEYRSVSDGLRQVGSDLQNWIASRSNSAIAPQVHFISDTVRAFNDYVHGEREGALAAVRQLDSMSGDGFHLADVLAQFGKNN